jgi:hypothetical protein
METKTIEKKGRRITMERPTGKNLWKITKNEGQYDETCQLYP